MSDLLQHLDSKAENLPELMLCTAFFAQPPLNSGHKRTFSFKSFGSEQASILKQSASHDATGQGGNSRPDLARARAPGAIIYEFMTTKRMLVDASHPEETRIVITNGNRLEEFDFEVIFTLQK